METDTATRKVLTRKQMRRIVDQRLHEYFRTLEMDFPEALRKLPPSSALKRLFPYGQHDIVSA